VNGKAHIRYQAKEARTISRVMRHPDSWWLVRAIAPAAAGYLLSLLQLMPTIIRLPGAFAAVRAFESRSR
jgi:hypothetical protein